jgi:ABC-type transporter Mla MlaB component
MLAPATFALEAHPTVATLYLCGRVTVASLIEMLHHCERLPHDVWLLRVDARAAEPLDAASQATLVHGLRRWRGGRAGATEVTPTPLPRASDAARARMPWRRQLPHGVTRP